MDRIDGPAMQLAGCGATGVIFLPGGGERCSKRRIVLLERRQMKQSMLIGGSRGYSSRARKGGGVNVNGMGGMCGRPGERWRLFMPADSMASDGVSWAVQGWGLCERSSPWCCAVKLENS